MRDVFVMWRSTKMTVLAALCAGAYAALLIPFKAIPIIPGFTEIRPANVVPIVTGMLFGPAAAWGCAFGNLIGDFFGTIGPGSFFGFIGNFVYAYVPYRLWRMFTRGRPATGLPAGAPVFALATIIGSMSCAVIIGWGVDLLGLVPYQVLTAVITLNNSVAGLLLGMLVLPLLYPRAKRWGLLYDDVMPAEDYTEGRAALLGAALVIVGAVTGALVALSLFLRPEDTSQLAVLLEGQPIKIVGGACALMILVGCGLFTRLPGRAAVGTRLVASATSMTRTSQATDPADVALQVDDLSFAYALSDGPALRGVSLDQTRGRLRMLMGETGAGKSTLCKCLNAVIPELQAGEFSGVVSLFGSDIAGAPVHQLTPIIGEVFQDFESQLLTSSVEGEVALPLENLGVDPDGMSERVQSALQSVGMWEFRQRDPVLLSGGEKQRVALAAVLVTEPSILVLDEPTTDLDPLGKRELLEQCDKLRDSGKTLVIAEHETDLALGADVLTVLKDGEVAYDDSPADLLTDPQRTEALGLRPLDMPALFQAIDRHERPLTVDEAADLLGAAEFDQKAWERLAESWPPKPLENQYDLGPPILCVRGVGHVYPGDVEALRCVSFDVREGEFIAILGENGSGKTTLAKHLNGLLRPTEGEVEVDGMDTSRRSPAALAATVGYLFQDPDHQIFAETVYEEVAFGPRNLKLPADKIHERVDKALQSLGLLNHRDADPFTLTKGERQQVALASILAMRPRVIVFDEPTTGLDGPQQKNMMDTLRELNDKGHTVIIITHCPWAAAEYAHRIILLDEGEIIADGPTRDILADDDALARAGQRVPRITELGKRLFGKTLLSVAEAAECLRGGDAR